MLLPIFNALRQKNELLRKEKALKRKIVDRMTSLPQADSTGVKLIRLLGHEAVHQYNPFLLLDIVDSTDPGEYEEGFPTHPHRGIELITYMISGELSYKESSGIQGTLKRGDVQWITAGSGILHEENPLPSDQMLFVQLWLNLPRKDKLVSPVYHTLSEDRLPIVSFRGGKLKVIAGEYGRSRGVQGKYVPLNFYHIFLRKGESLSLRSDTDDLVMMVLLRGNMNLSGEEIEEKHVVLFGQGNEIDMEALGGNAQALYISAPRLQESVYWGGPVIMNNESDLLRAFEDLRMNEFIKELPKEIRE